MMQMASLHSADSAPPVSSRTRAMLATDQRIAELLAAQEGMRSRWRQLDASTAALAERKAELVKLNGSKTPRDKLKLNCGGAPITTRRSTLCNLFPDTMLAALFSGRWDRRLLRDSKKRVFLDVHPEFVTTPRARPRDTRPVLLAYTVHARHYHWIGWSFPSGERQLFLRFCCWSQVLPQDCGVPHRAQAEGARRADGAARGPEGVAADARPPASGSRIRLGAEKIGSPGTSSWGCTDS